MTPSPPSSGSVRVFASAMYTATSVMLSPVQKRATAKEASCRWIRKEPAQAAGTITCSAEPPSTCTYWPNRRKIVCPASWKIRLTPCRNRRAAEARKKSRPWAKTCQPSAARTSSPSARPAIGAKAMAFALASGLRRGRAAVTVDGAGGRAALFVDGEVGDAAILAAERTLGIAPELDLAEAHAEGVIRREPADQRLADAEQQLDRLGRLHQPDHAWEHAQEAGLASAGDKAWRRRGGVETAVARSLIRREDRRHAFELEDGAVDIGLAGQITGVVDEIASVEIVGAVHHQVVVLDGVHHIVDVDAHGQRDDVRVGIQRPEHLGARLDLGPADIGRGVQDLALQVRHVHDIAVHEPERADPGRGEVHGRRGAQASRPDEQHFGAQQLALPLLAHLIQEEIAAVALDLLRGQRPILYDGQSGLRPLLEYALEVDDVGVAEIFQRSRRQHRAQPGLAVEDDGRRVIGDRAADAEFEEAAADIGGRLDEAVAVLVRITHVDERDGLSGVEALLELRRALFGHHLPGFGEHLFQRFHPWAPCLRLAFQFSSLIIALIPVGSCVIRSRSTGIGLRLL